MSAKPMNFTVIMLSDGRFTIPAAVRRANGMKAGTQFDVSESPDGTCSIMTHLPKNGESYMGSWRFNVQGG